MPFVAEKFFFQMKTGRERHNPVFSIRIGQGERVSTHRQDQALVNMRSYI